MMAFRNTFFIAGYGPLQCSHKETFRRLQVMVKVMGLFSVLIEETIRRLQIMVQVMMAFRDRFFIAGYGPLQRSHQIPL